MPSFHVDDSLCVRMEVDFAIRLGELLIDADTIDKQLKALGHRLVQLGEDGQEDDVGDDPSVPTYSPVTKAYVPEPIRPAPGRQPVFQHRPRRRIP